MSDAPERLYFYDDWLEKNTKGRLLCGNNEYIRADLAKPKVKPLVWECFDGWTWWAKLEIVTYRVNERGGIWTTTIASGLPDIDGLIEFEGNTEEAAKAAAQADHERRIMECLICP